MNILYYSVHQILEDDEVRLLRSLGHNVCCLGINGKNGAIQNFRPRIEFSEEEISFYDQLVSAGGYFAYGEPAESTIIPAEFIDIFDVVLVMHDTSFIKRWWPILSRRPVIWRTIGQNIEGLEAEMAPFRNQGMYIVRYSPVESLFAGSIGCDECIRFSKSSDVFNGWVGEKRQVLTFSNDYSSRYPGDFENYLNIVSGFESVLGGNGNGATKGAVGLVGFEEQLSLYRNSRAYLYCSGLQIPYTLNFIEAWMVGMPMVLYAPRPQRGRYFELSGFINDGIDGFVCESVESAIDVLRMLFDSKERAIAIGAAGRQSAVRIFSSEVCRQKWSDLLGRFK